MVSDGTADSLPYPPGSIRAETVTARRVELAHRAQQTQVTLLNQVEEGDAPSGVAFGHADNQTQVGAHHRAGGLRAALLNPVE